MSEAVNVKPARPQYRNIGLVNIAFKYRLPLAGRVSIMHRVSGLLLFFALPLILFLLEQSLVSEMTYETFRSVVGSPIGKLVVLALSWAYLHHFCAGVRHLFMDLHMGIEKKSGTQSAVVVLVVSLLATLAVAGKLYGVF